MTIATTRAALPGQTGPGQTGPGQPGFGRPEPERPDREPSDREPSDREPSDREASGCVGHRGVEERELSADGFRFVSRVAWCEHPSTEPFLILGGSSQDRLSWTRFERALLPLGHVITVDLPGYGGAAFLPARHGIDFLADAVLGTLDDLGVSRANLLGACFGGAIGLRFAQRHPDRVRRLMLVGMTRDLPKDYTDCVPRWMAMLAEGRSDDIARELVDRFMSPPGTGTVRRYAAVSRLLYRQFAGRSAEEVRMDVEHNHRLMSHDWYVPRPAPRVPALVLTGEHDTLTPPAMGLAAARCLEGAWFTTVKEADHLLPVERSDELGDLIARFCTDRAIDPLPYCHPATFVPAAGQELPGNGAPLGMPAAT
ncbi:alpha/beta fold hydrolase [Streptomyces sp. NPDC088194]|uniref:alpha/beta fold hydrolase n=1 Tax=Streptomyces sp. NPDC088194 TaxID=3154931 RepID=UPI00344BB367